MDSISRRIKNSQRTNISFKDGTPSKSTLTEGEEIMTLRKNKGLSLFRKQKGILWWVNFTRDGNETIERDLKVNGNAEFSRDLTVHGNLIGQRAYFDAGESSTFSGSRYLNYNDGTVMTSNNGYIMMRPGSITGISTCFNAVNVSGGGQLSTYAEAKINGTTKYTTATVSYSTDGTGKKASRVQARGIDKFVSGDVLSMYVTTTEAGMITGNVDNMNVIVEVTYDS
jgi:hypothetical protein